MSSDKVPTSLEDLVGGMTDLLAPTAASLAGLEVDDFRKRLKVTFQVSGVINASVRHTADWSSFEIVMNDALMLFYHKMLKVFVSTIGIGTDEQHAVEKPTVQPKKILSVSKKLLIAYCEGTILRKKSFFVEELGRGQTALLARLVRAAECFDIAHELGHVVYGIKKGQVPQQELAGEMIEWFLSLTPDLPDEAKKEVMEPWREELCADLIGLKITLAKPLVPPYDHWPHYQQYLCGGAEISHLLHMLVWDFEGRLMYSKNIRLTSSHPHSYLRQKTLTKSPDRIAAAPPIDFGKMFGSFAVWILNELFRKTPESGYELK